MKIEEVRIGNYIKSEQINLFRIDQIYFSKHQGYMLKMNIDIDNDSFLKMPIELAEPIEISTEFLLNNGFKVTSVDSYLGECYENKELRIQMYRYVGCWSIHIDDCDYDSIFFTYINYIHEYQNALMFALKKDIPINI